MSIVVKDHSKALMAEMAFLATHEVRVGVLTALDGNAKKTGSKATLTVAEVFAFHELGRGRNPKRSSIVWVMDNKAGDIEKTAIRALGLVVEGKMSGRVALSLVGERVVSLAKSRIKSRIPPGLSVARLRQKKRAGKSGETPLIHTGQMINSLRFNVIGSI